MQDWTYIWYWSLRHGWNVCQENIFYALDQQLTSNSLYMSEEKKEREIWHGNPWTRIKMLIQIHKNSYLLQKTEIKNRRIHPFPKLWNTTTPLFLSSDSYCKTIIAVIWKKCSQFIMRSNRQQSGKVTLVCLCSPLNDHLLQSLHADCIHLHQIYN